MTRLATVPEPDGAALRAPAPAWTVLVVGDSRAQRRVLTTLLTGWGYRVLQAASGPEALQVVQFDSPDILISDWLMHGMTGLDLCQACRSLPDGGFFYFIILTSKSASADIARGLEMGADDFLPKPVNPTELRARLIAGTRVVQMQRELIEKNQLLKRTLSDLGEVQTALENDLREARRFQESLVPENAVNYGGAVVFHRVRPSGHVGGDLVGSFPVNDTRLGAFAIDVSGHGVASALMAARVASYLTGNNPDQNIALCHDPGGGLAMRPLADVAAELNTTLLRDLRTHLYLTMVLMDVDLAAGEIRLVQAGHPPPILLSRDGRARTVGAGGLPVGLVPGADYSVVSAPISAGDRVLMYSDGVTEQADPTGEEYGEGRLLQALGDLAGVQGVTLIHRLVRSVHDFAGKVSADDDISLLLLETAGPPSEQEDARALENAMD